MVLGRKVYPVYVSNLPINIKKEDLQELFKGCGPIDNIYVSTLSPDMSYLYGFVRYQTLAGAERAVSELAGWPVMGHKLRVEWAKEMQQDIESVRLGRRSLRRASPEDDLNMKMVLKCIEKINEKAIHDSERVSTTLMLEAISKESNCPVPMRIPKEATTDTDFMKLDQLMEQELSSSS